MDVNRNEVKTGDGDHEVVVIGSGPAGLSCAAELVRCGVNVVVLEKGGCVGAAWASRYDVLRLNTSRFISAVPHAPFPWRAGIFPSRDDVVGYLQSYGARRRVDVRCHAEARRIDPVDGPESGWSVRCANGSTYRARHVVIATGLLNRPRMPSWPGRHSFCGRLLHAAEYRSATEFIGQDVLVVGAGSSGFDIAHDLVHGGARQVRLSVRTPPNILLRSLGGLPLDLPVPLLWRLPPRWTDRFATWMRRLLIGDLTGVGLPMPDEGPFALQRRTGQSPAGVDRGVLTAIRDGRIAVVPAVTGLCPSGAELVGGNTADTDVVIAATGYTTGLGRLVGHLDVLGGDDVPRAKVGEEALPGLRFAGYDVRPGLTRYGAVIGQRVAHRIAAAENNRQITERRPGPAATRLPGDPIAVRWHREPDDGFL